MGAFNLRDIRQIIAILALLIASSNKYVVIQESIGQYLVTKNRKNLNKKNL